MSKLKSTLEYLKTLLDQNYWLKMYMMLFKCLFKNLFTPCNYDSQISITVITTWVVSKIGILSSQLFFLLFLFLFPSLPASLSLFPSLPPPPPLSHLYFSFILSLFRDQLFITTVTTWVVVKRRILFGVTVLQFQPVINAYCG